MFDLKGKTALVTGGSSGIGLAAAKAFVEAGAQVAIFARNGDTLAAAQQELGPQALAVQGDAAKLADIDRLLETVTGRFGKIDVLAANAGVAKFAPLEAVDEAHFDQQFDVNVKGLYFTVAKAAPHLSDGASVILTASIVAQTGLPATSVYSATKAAVRSLSRTFAAELAPRKIRVNTVSPGPVETPIYGKLGFSPEQLDGFAQGALSRVALGRFGAPREIAGAMLFLASEAGGFVTGADLQVDGGFGQL